MYYLHPRIVEIRSFMKEIMTNYTALDFKPILSKNFFVEAQPSVYYMHLMNFESRSLMEESFINYTGLAKKFNLSKRLVAEARPFI